MPRVSVIMGVWNRERTIRDSVESVFAQTYTDYEVIVVDDASTDGTFDLLMHYEKRIRLYRRASNSGLPSVPRNEAMRMANGEFLAFLDSDDLWYPAKLEKQVAFMDRHPDVGLCHTLCRVIDAESKERYIRKANTMPESEQAYEELVKECFITTSSVLLRRDVTNKAGVFNEHPALRCGEDREYYLRIARIFRIGFIPEVLSAYRLSNDNIMGDEWMLHRNILNTQLWILRHEDLWQGKVTRQFVREAYIDKVLNGSYHWQSKHNRGKSLLLVLHGLRQVPFSGRLWRRGVGALLSAG